MVILRQRIPARSMVQKAVASIRNLFLLLPQQMIMPPPPGIHRVLNRLSFIPVFFFSFPSAHIFSPCCVVIKCLYPWRSLNFLYSCSASLLPSLLLSCAFYLTHIYCKSVCCPISVRFSPSFFGANTSNPLTHSLGRSLCFLATLFISFIPVFIVCQFLDGLFHSLSITLFFRPLATFFRPPLRKSVVYRSPSVCLYGPTCRVQTLCASNLHFHTFFCLLVSHKQIVASLTSCPTLPIRFLLLLTYLIIPQMEMTLIMFFI